MNDPTNHPNGGCDSSFKHEDEDEDETPWFCEGDANHAGTHYALGGRITWCGEVPTSLELERIESIERLLFKSFNLPFSTDLPREIYNIAVGRQ